MIEVGGAGKPNLAIETQKIWEFEALLLPIRPSSRVPRSLIHLLRGDNDLHGRSERVYSVRDIWGQASLFLGKPRSLFNRRCFLYSRCSERPRHSLVVFRRIRAIKNGAEAAGPRRLSILQSVLHREKAKDGPLQ